MILCTDTANQVLHSEPSRHPRHPVATGHQCGCNVGISTLHTPTTILNVHAETNPQLHRRPTIQTIPSTTVLYNCCWCSNRRVGLPKRTNTAIIAKYKSISILGSSVKTTAVVNTTVPGWHRCCTARPKYASAPLSRTLRLGSCAEQVPEVQ
mgnify:FL=1